MPAKYEAIRDEIIRTGTPRAKAKASAARIYNAQRKPGQTPVTGRSERSFGDAITRKRY
jgi:hypothetical protein